MSDNKRSSKDIPRIAPTRDEVASRQHGRPRSSVVPNGGGSGVLVRLLVAVGLVTAAVACVWAWQLQQQLHESQSQLEEYAARISDLEDRLSDTDEGMNQSAATMSVKIKELYSEVDKLWASAWRKNTARIDSLEKTASENFTQLEEANKSYSAQLKLLADDIGRLQSVAGDLQRLTDSSKTNQELMERVGDDVSRTALELAKLSKRVQAGEEWQGSVDGFRRQVNRNILELRKEVSRLQSDRATANPGARPGGIAPEGVAPGGTAPGNTAPGGAASPPPG